MISANSGNFPGKVKSILSGLVPLPLFNINSFDSIWEIISIFRSFRFFPNSALSLGLTSDISLKRPVTIPFLPIYLALSWFISSLLSVVDSKSEKKSFLLTLFYPLLTWIFSQIDLTREENAPGSFTTKSANIFLSKLIPFSFNP